MSNISPVNLTKIAAGSGTQTSSALQGSANGIFSNVSGVSFIDLIIAKLTSGEDVQKTTPASDNKDVASLGSLKNENPLTLLQIALASQTKDENGNVVLGTTEKTTKNIQSQLGLTNQIIEHLKNLIPENPGKEGIFSKLLAKLQTKSDTLQASLSTLNNGVISKDTPVENLPMPVLIALGLKPSEIADIADKVQALEKKLGREITVEDLIVGVGGILPPPQTSVLGAVVVQPPKLAGSENEKDVIDSIDSDSSPSDDLAEKLNDIDVGSGDKKADDFRKLLPKDALDQSNQTKNGSENQTFVNDKKPASTAKENIIHLLNNNKAIQGNMTFPANLVGSDIDNALFQQYGINGTPSLNLGTTAQSANIIGTTASAGQSHPATNLVAAQIIKYAPNGTDQTMMLRLDPPELGQVSIRLKFGKDNAIKAHMTVEKPETFMMLSRDSHALERALQHAGLDANANSISFELANQGDNPFNNNGEDNNKDFGNGGAGALQDASASDETIQSSVAWQVDPSTGRVRYNIFA